MADLLSGTVTFLFTDIEGSTRLWEQHPDAMREALARHHAIITAAVDQHGGRIVAAETHAVIIDGDDARRTGTDHADRNSLT